MKALYFLLSVLGFSAIIISCQREVSDELPPNGPPVGGDDSTVLWKFVVLDTTRAPGQDTADFYYYDYDASDRISHVSNGWYDAGSSGPSFDYWKEIDFYYNGTDTVPFKTTSESFDEYFQEHRFDTTMYTYQNGLVSAIATRSVSTTPTETRRSTFTVQYTVNGSTVTTLSRSSTAIDPAPPGPVCETTHTYINTYTNGNITNERVTSAGCVTGSGIDLTFTFDNKINPFYKIETRFPVIDYDVFAAPLPVQKNNLTAAGTYRYAYTYKPNGYPATVKISDATDPDEHGKGIYFYKK